MVLLAVSLIAFGWWPFACNSEYCKAIDVSSKGEQSAIDIVARSPDGAKQKRLHPGDTWLVAGSIELASRTIPLYCPGEYFVTLKDKSHYVDISHDHAPRWLVDINSRRIVELNTAAEIWAQIPTDAARPRTTEDDRVSLCMNGKPQAMVDGAPGSDRVDGDPHEPSR